MPPAAPGSRISLSFAGITENGALVCCEEEDLIEFTLGRNEASPRLETAVLGLKEGDTALLRIPPEEALGPWRPDLVVRVELGRLVSLGLDPSPGARLPLSIRGVGDRLYLVAGVRAGMVTLDGNHPLAGKEFLYRLRVERVSRGPGVLRSRKSC